ncbi:MAG TPA: hypothetical protein VJ783_12940 [Pirellulales bacterium]|nr:hypothetical protein [Pirellulales bacterium]
MIKEGVQPLDSLRLVANYAAQAPCYICGDDNTYDAELCRQCFAPMALTHQAASQKIRPRLLATIGASGVGKTVYLGMLMDMLSRQPDRLQMLARGAFSITLQQSTASALARGEFPSKTPSEPDRWNWVHCQIRSPSLKIPLDLVMPDLAGEALLEEVDHPHTYDVIHPLLSKCAGVLILIDAVKLQAGSLDQDYFTMKLLSYLAEIDERPKHGWARRPIGFVLTKADECEECFVDPARFAEVRAPGFWRQCRERFRNYQFFASGVAGGCAYRQTRAGLVRVPLRVEPRGIVEPFEWLVQQVKS